VTITARPIVGDRCHIDDRSPIGTRYTDGTSTYTLVAYELSPARRSLALPVLVDDDELDAPRTEFDFLSDGSIPLMYPMEIVDADGVLAVAPGDSEMADRARAAAVKRYNEPPVDTGDLHRVLAFEDLATVEEVKAFHLWAEAELAVRKAQYDLARASAGRDAALQRVANLTGSRDSAGRVVGLVEPPSVD
jgi:hypothetical protein